MQSEAVEKCVQSAVLSVIAEHPMGHWRDDQVKEVARRAIAEAALSTDAEPVAWTPTDLEKGRLYESPDFGTVEYLGTDVYYGETTLKFETGRRDIHRYKYVLPKNLNAFLQPKAGPVKTAPAVAVKVKPLEWRQGYRDENVDIFQALTLGGLYQVRTLNGVVWLDNLGAQVVYPSVEEAKAAAQADYEARILSALSAQVQDAAVPALKIGIYGKAYDRPDERRAYTYDEQPHNVEAYKLGRVCSEIHSGGDWIDRGLNLLKALQREGFGVFELPSSPASKHGDAE